MHRRRNLLVIVSDEHDPRYMGCSGTPWIQTPNLDALARRGTRFANAYTASPICVPARASLATGRHVHQHAYWDNAFAYEGRWTSWHHRLSAAGVRTESIGKLHFRAESDPTGFARQLEPMHIHGGVGLVWGAVRDPLPETRGRSPIFDDLGAGLSAYNRYDQRISEATRDWLAQRAAEHDGAPWALFVGFVAPHMPLVVPQQYLDLYPLDAIPAPKLLPEEGHARHPWVERMVRHWDHDAALGTPERRALARACYFGLVSYLDARVGEVLATLEQCGLAESTTVVYTSDHGDNLGTRAMWNKSTLYRESVSVPMIVCGADVPAGALRTTPVGLVDIYPTALDALAIPRVPEERGLPGESLLALAASPDRQDRLALSEYHAVGAQTSAFMLADARYKYHHYVGFPPELFDLVSDPEETRNLAADPAHAQRVKWFETRLRDLLDPEALDRRVKDEQNDLVARFGGREAALRQGNPGPTAAPDPYRMH